MRRARSKRVGRALLGAAVAGSAVACSLTTSLDGLTGGADDAGTDGLFADAPAPGLDANPKDDSARPPDGDAASPDLDAGFDAARDADAGPWCASLSPAPLFCDDFDEGKLAAPWDSVSGLNGTASLAGAVYTSAPYAMLVTTLAQANNYDVAAYKSFSSLAGTAYVFTLSFDVRVAEYDTTASSGADLAAISLYGAAGNSWAVELDVSYDSAANALDVDLSEDAIPGDGGANTYTSHPVATPLPLATWTRISIQLTLSNPIGVLGSNTASVSFDGNLVGSESLTIPIVNGTPEAIVGATYVNPKNTAWAIRYDDVTFDAKPP